MASAAGSKFEFSFWAWIREVRVWVDSEAGWEVVRGSRDMV